MDALSFLFNDLVFLRIPRKSLKFLTSLFSIPTAPTKNLDDSIAVAPLSGCFGRQEAVILDRTWTELFSPVITGLQPICVTILQEDRQVEFASLRWRAFQHLRPGAVSRTAFWESQNPCAYPPIIISGIGNSEPPS